MRQSGATSTPPEAGEIAKGMVELLAASTPSLDNSTWPCRRRALSHSVCNPSASSAQCNLQQATEGAAVAQKEEAVHGLIGGCDHDIASIMQNPYSHGCEELIESTEHGAKDFEKTESWTLAL
ncbi:hypothetical protein TrVFT333_008528 [Trichoderma virens FT-333]|nr:hypothetical protein TrVFT333_008528 [Trichoderma virens FT-333]